MSTDNPEGDRIAKVLSRAGVASRRDAERMILDGRVKVNGKVVTSPALNVAEGDRLMVDNAPVAPPEPTRVWVYHKPAGVVTTTADEQGRETVFEGLPEDMPRVMSVGRLDLTSEGLLLLTNDGEVKRRLELPSTGWLRRYRVRINGTVSEAQLERLRAGVTVEDVDYAPMEVQFDRQQGANAWLTVGLREGKNREIRRVMEYLGVTVNRLIRVSYGPFQLGDLEPGGVKELPRRVVKDQIGAAGEDEQVLTRRVRGERPVKVKPVRTGPVMRTTKGALRPGEGGTAKPSATKPGTGKPARAGRTADRPGWGADKAAAVAEARGEGPRSAGFKSHGARGEVAAGSSRGAGRSAGFKSHRAAEGDAGPRKAPYKPKGPVTGADAPRGPKVRGKGDFAPRGPREGHAPRGEGAPRAEGYKSRAPRAEGDRAPREGYKPRGEGAPRAEGYKSRGPRAEGERAPREGYKPRGEGAAKSEGYKSRAPRAEGERAPREGYKPRGEGAAAPRTAYKPRGEGAPRSEGSKPRAPRAEGEGEGARKPRHKSGAAGFKPRSDDAPRGGPPTGRGPGKGRKPQG